MVFYLLNNDSTYLYKEHSNSGPYMVIFDQATDYSKAVYWGDATNKTTLDQWHTAFNKKTI